MKEARKSLQRVLVMPLTKRDMSDIKSLKILKFAFITKNCGKNKPIV